MVAGACRNAASVRHKINRSQTLNHRTARSGAVSLGTVHIIGSPEGGRRERSVAGGPHDGNPNQGCPTLVLDSMEGGCMRPEQKTRVPASSARQELRMEESRVQ